MTKTIIRICAVMCCVLFHTAQVLAQPQPIIEHYGVEQGLPHPSVYGALRDDDGMLWICTWNGIALYDGYSFKTFVRNAPGHGDTPPHKVSEFIDDGQGHLWMRNMDNAFYMFDKRSARFTDIYPYMKPHAKNMLVRKIKDIGEGKILFVTRDKNLFLAYTDRRGEPVVKKIYDAARDIDKTTLQLRHNVEGESAGYLFWMGTDMSIDAVRRGSKDMERVVSRHNGAEPEWVRLIPHEGDSIMSEMKVCDAGRHGVFVLSRSGRLYLYNRGTKALVSMDSEGLAGLKSKTTTYHDIFRDSDGDIWLSSDKDGLFKITFPTGVFKMVLPHLFGMEYNKGVRALFRTSDGILLVGCRGERLRAVSPATGEVVYTFDENVQNIYHIMQDNSGAIWLSSKGHGLIKVTPTKNPAQRYVCEYFRHDPKNPYSINCDRVYHTMQDHTGRIWVCTFGGGVNLMENINGTTVFHHHANTFKNYPRGDLFIDVRAIEEDRNHVLWAATTNGLMRIQCKADNSPAGIEFETGKKHGDDIYSIYRDTNGDIWLGILGNGLNKIIGYDKESHTAILERHGDCDIWRNETIIGMIQDRQGCLWVGMDNGMASLDMKTGAVHDYDRHAGFPQVHIEDNTAVLMPDGKLLMGCKEGLLAFSPEQLKRNTGKRYKTFIMGMRVMNHDIADIQPSVYDGNICYADTIVLNYNQNMFSLEFATMKYSSHSQLSYSYILEGHEHRHHIADNSNVAAYSDVPPGTYTFRVRAIGDDYPERRLTIIILPPWWATWWAFTIYAIILAAIAYGVFRLVTYIIRMRNEIYIHKRMDTIKKQVLRQHNAEKENEFVMKVTKIVEDNLSMDMNVDSIAEELGLSRSAFFKRLKALTGKAPVDFVKEIRLTRAANLLSTTNLGVTEIAYQVGFNDPGYFGKCFRKRFDMSPKEYKNKVQPDSIG